MTKFSNKGYIEARALYEEDTVDDAIEKAKELLVDNGIARAFENEDQSLTVARESSVSSHQMLHDYYGICR